ncbi:MULTISPECIES: MetQ/NlpA family ABC transporter substrate-binding protein [Alteribacter]|uniref:Lipoprotein n=1 Tax=Alteribacter keqinensis TaxID=2483800 RepID=A0A3M7TYD2_9BACI|nr:MULTISPECIES: MetQ/NlpA family ABC transporter substrate-binding protein [Alteribacter]MBM7096103.1 hypothetical protein [Alteribacter salitolerans]RNA69912.1 hypothetical protein EBO34_08265 [Alteribacter keqinensis]
MKKAALLGLGFGLSVLAACSGGESEAGGEEKKELKIGATAGPYSDMVEKAIKPSLEELGYSVDVVEFSDYVQPNLSLANGDIDANLFQHKIYMETFAEDNGLDLSEVIVVPTAPMGIYSDEYDSLDDIEDGTQIAVPNDPTNVARVFLMLEDEGLITLSDDATPTTVSERDVEDNPKNLQFQAIEAAQLPRAVDSVDLAAVPGNFALAAEMDLLDALALEEMPDDYRNRVVVNTDSLDEPFAEDLRKAVESEAFANTIDEEFQGFGKPEWMDE